MPLDQQTLDFHWFVENYDALFKQYGKSFLVIKDRAVVGSFKNLKDGVKDAFSKYKPKTFIIQECDGTPDAYTGYIASMNFKADDYV